MRDKATTKLGQFWPTGVILALLWSILFSWLLVEQLADRRHHLDGLRSSGLAGIGMLQVAVQSPRCARRQDPGFLGDVLAQVTTIPGSLGAWICEGDGTIIAANGEVEDLPEPVPGPLATWRPDGLLLEQRIELGACPFDGRGRRRAAGFAQRPLFVYLLLDRAGVDADIARNLRLRIAILLGASIILVFLFLLSRSRARRMALNMKLSLAEERSQRHREWALAGAGMAHETKNPLSIVRGHAQRLLTDGLATSERSSCARQIVDETDRVVARINEFLSLSRPIEPHLEPLAITPLLHEMAALVEPDLEASGTQITVAADSLSIQADRDMTRQILLNLIVNAIHSCEDGGAIELRAQPLGSREIALEVRDNGRGMEAEELEHIFEPYFSRAAGGTGLGLAIVRRLAEVQGWRIEAASAPEEGASFRILGIQRPDDER